ncbi:tautomerase family protein [Methylobacterium sp. J-090]|uniref:tautomerase family protein n=1 Tax=Methylobacterium sp. J-090 TaxID=2836666 RepID=UPI001FB9937B|nr:tautomerase family protein [Methylobacterium sp. J-090]MCJ2081939.1 tautomerase family protein [Methylobacterium sp. J-090]
MAEPDGVEGEMPFVNVKVAGPIAAAQIEDLQAGITALMADVLRKKADLTAVLIERVETASWTVGAAPVTVAAHLDAKVTSGTNTTQEKAHFVTAAHALLGAVLGRELPTATYVVIDEVPGDAWGYAGQTQAYRAGLRAAAA